MKVRAVIRLLERAAHSEIFQTAINSQIFSTETLKSEILVTAARLSISNARQYITGPIIIFMT